MTKLYPKMFETLHQVILDNKVHQYLTAAAIILLGLFFKRYIARYVAMFVGYLIFKRYKQVSQTSFHDLVTKPLGFFILIFIIVVALDQLTFPRQLDFNIYHLNTKELFRMISSALLIITFFSFLIKCIDFVMLLLKERFMKADEQSKHQLVFFFKDFIKVLIGIIGFLLILKYTFNYDIKGLVTGLSIVGAAVALAMKESLENFIASFIIFFDKPFETGDAVKVNSVSGTIESIGLRSTRIRTDAKTYVTVPNKQMVDSIVDNTSNRTQFHAHLKLEIVVSTPAEKVEQFVAGIRKILANTDVQTYKVFVNTLTSNAIVITLDYYSKTTDDAIFSTVRQQVNMDLLKLMEQLSISLVGESTNVNILSGEKKN